jgi:hypothetical protein
MTPLNKLRSFANVGYATWAHRDEVAFRGWPVFNRTLFGDGHHLPASYERPVVLTTDGRFVELPRDPHSGASGDLTFPATERAIETSPATDEEWFATRKALRRFASEHDVELSA